MLFARRILSATTEELEYLFTHATPVSTTKNRWNTKKIEYRILGINVTLYKEEGAKDGHYTVSVLEGNMCASHNVRFKTLK